MWIWLSVWMAFAGCQDDPAPVRDEEAAVEFVLPEGWTLHLQSGRQGTMIIRMYSQSAAAERRFVVLDFPTDQVNDFAPRVQELSSAYGIELEVVEADVDGWDAEEVSYDVSTMRTIERGVARDDRYQVFQVSAPIADWESPERGEDLERIFTSLSFLELPRPEIDAGKFDAKTPDEIRALRAAATVQERQFALRHHDVELHIDPVAGSLVCTDEFVIEALVDGVDQLGFAQSYVEIDSIERDGEPVSYTILTQGVLVIDLAEPLAKGEKATFVYRGHADDYCFSYEQDLIAEIEMLGQVRESSTFSSHVHYYPVDNINDATVTMTMHVPEGFTAVSGGDVTDPEGASARFEVLDRHPRILPLGFAVDRYELFEGSTEDGLAIEFYCPTERVELGEEYLELALRCAELFHGMMGPLPWGRVAFAVVEPVRREMGVSLPGLILLSPSYFGDLSEVEIDGARLSSPEMGRFLIVADELAHQWNAYSAPLPNELAEGISTFTNLLYIESEADFGEYVEGVAFCSRVYLENVAPLDDVALADPGIYSSAGYRLIAFCKVASVLHDLRMRLGDEAFFRGWRRVFETVKERKTAFDAFRQAFEWASEEDLQSYFDNWFFRAGRPRVRLDWSVNELASGGQIAVSLTQIDDGPAFEFEVDVELEFADGETERRRMSVRSRNHTETWAVDAAPVEVALDPDGVGLFDRR